MSRLATRRLIDAASSLPEAERALLNLWINRGLDDHALAAMTRITTDAVAARRNGIVEHLSEALGLPPAEIHEALTEIAATSAEELARAPGPQANGQAGAIASAGSGVDDDGPEAGAAPAEAVETPTPAGPARGRGRGLRAAIGALLVLLVVVVIVAVSSGGGGAGRRASASVSATNAATATPTSPTSPSPSPTVSRPPTQPLGALPGGLARAHGSVVLTGKLRHLRLRLSVMDLPAAHRGHYEVWLYNSILDSRPLARLRNGVHHLNIRVPPGAHHYRWIDISFQPVGFINHSGESVLRAANPATQSPRRLRRRSARRRQLHQALGGPSKHRAKRGSTRHRAKGGSRRDRARRARSGSRRHHPRRARSGSKKARTSK
jgi:hypothetical protein